MQYVVVILLSYLLGTSNMALYLSKLLHTDMTKGSGNLGASNAVILMGWPAGVLVAVHDIGRAALAVFLARLAFPDAPHIGAVAGVSSVLGHIFPFYLKFKGGKGFASYLGMALALNWKMALVLMVVIAVVTVVFDYIVVGTATTVVVVPIWIGIATHSIVAALILLIATGVILFKHRENLERLRNGTEIGLRSTMKKDKSKP